MSSPPKRHLTDLRYSSLSPSQHGKRDKQHYGSAGDVTSNSRRISKLEARMNENNNCPKKPVDGGPLENNSSDSQSDHVSPSLDTPLPTTPSPVTFSAATQAQSLPEDVTVLNDDPSDTHNKSSFGTFAQQASSSSNSVLTNTNPPNNDSSNITRGDNNSVPLSSDRYKQQTGLHKEHIENDNFGMSAEDLVDERNIPSVKKIIKDFESKKKTRNTNKHDLIPYLDKFSKETDSSKLSEDIGDNETSGVTDECKAFKDIDGNKTFKNNANFKKEIEVVGTSYVDEDLGKVTMHADMQNEIQDAQGAVGGQTDLNIQGILQKSPSDIPQKKSSSVQFNDEVTVEMFSQTDPTASSTTKAALAQGDGPSPAASLRLSLNESGFTSDLPSMQISFNEMEIFSERNPSPDKLTDNQTVDQIEKPLKRRDSMPRVLSPTALLHRKQKVLASSHLCTPNLSSSMTSGPSTNDYIHIADLQNQRKIEDIKKAEDIASDNALGKPSSLGQDECQLPFDSDIKMLDTHVTDTELNEETSIKALVSHEKLFDSKFSERIYSPEFRSSEENFSLSGYNLKDYLIESTEISRENSGYEATDNSLSTKSPVNPALPDLKQKIISENLCARVDINHGSNQSHDQQSTDHDIEVERSETESIMYTISLQDDQKRNNIETVDKNLPGLLSFSYTSPSKLHQKITDRDSAEKNSPGIGSFSYTSPSKLHQKITDRDSAEKKSPGIGSFSHTSPSKLHQKIIDRDSAEKNSPGIGSFSYTSPSKLHQMVSDRESADKNITGIESFSYTTPSELFRIHENMEKASTKRTTDEDSHVDLRESITRNTLSKEDIVFNKSDMEAYKKVLLQNFKDVLYEDLLNVELNEFELTKEEAKHWRKRCERKQHLDDLCMWTHANSQSDVLLKKVLSNASSPSSAESLNTDPGDEESFDDELELDERWNNSIPVEDFCDLDRVEGTDVKGKGLLEDKCEKVEIGKTIRNGWKRRCKRKQRLDNIQRWTQDHSQSDILLKKTISDESNCLLKSNESSEFDLSTNTLEEKGILLGEKDGNDLHTSLVNINHSLVDFLLHIKEKHVKDIPVNNEDFKELMLLQALMSKVSNQIEETRNEEDERKSDFSNNIDGSEKNRCRLLLNKMRSQLDWARIMLSGACTNMARYQSDVVIKNVDSIESGYLGETDENEENTEPFVDVEIANTMTKVFSDKVRNDITQRLKKSNGKDVKGRTSSIETDMHDKNAIEVKKRSKKCDLDKDGFVNGGDIAVTDDSLEVHVPESDTGSIESSTRMMMLTCVDYPDDSRKDEFDPSYVKLGTEDWCIVHDQLVGIPDEDRDQHLSSVEGSPERSQRLYGSSQNLDRRDGGGGKRKQASRSMTPDSRFMLDKEVTESQNRKLQTEVATLQTENRLLKEKYTRAQGRITDLETQLSEAQDDLANLQESLNQEVSDLSTRTKQEISRDRDSLEARILALSKENEAFKLEISSLEQRLESSHRATDMARHNSEKSRTLEAHKSEITSLKEELNRVKALLEQSERHLRDEEERHMSAGKEIVKLTELKNALQQQADTGGIAATTDKQLKSLEKRLKVTEERLHQERADRANNLSSVEDKLLTENSKLQASEKELGRQLHREKEKNRNFEQRVKQLREENEKLRLAMPYDDTSLLSNKGNYDIPYSSHSNQRAETMKHISDDMNYILSQIEKQDGLQSSEDADIIRTLWNKRELAYRQLREYDLQFQELHITDNNIADGLKNLRDTYGQAESKLRDMEECVEDAKAQVSTLDATYQQQLSVLVHERHEAFARLKTAEDLLEAIRAENEVLHHSLSVGQTVAGHRQPGDHTGKSPDALQAEMTQLESKVSQLTRTNQMMEAELKTIRVQLEARDKALKDVQTELDLAYNRLKGDDTEDRKQEKINKLSAQVSSLQVELKILTDKYTSMCSDNTRLESEINSLRKQTGSQKVRQQKSEQNDSKVIQQLKENIEERDSKLTSLTKQLDDLENQLQKTRQDLYIEQMHTSELETENENLQQTVGQRAQMFESLSGSEREQLAQYQILKETLDSVSQELAQKHAQIISLDVNLSGARDRCVELEEEMRRLHKVHSGDNEDQEAYTEDEQSSAHQLKIKELEKERSLLKQELEQAYSAIQASEEQYRTLQTESAQLEQELVKEKTVILQITAEKGEIEQHLEELAEEHESLIHEKSQTEEDLIKLETKLQEILQKYETQARKQHNNFEQQYPGLPPEAKKLVSEMETLTLIVDGKEREISMLNDKINRQHIEIEFLHRKVELVHNDSIANREDIARMISELTLKMKEAVSTREVNQFLVGERTKLQNEKSHLEKELEIERKNNDERKVEIQDVIRKIERTETTQKSTEKDSRDKDNAILTLESDLRNTKHNLTGMESEVTLLRNKVDNLNEDLKNLTGINGSLEKRLEMEKNSRELEAREEELTTLRDDLSNTKVELDSNKGQLLITKDTVQKLTQDKGSIYQDYEGMCRSLTEKERQLTELRERTDEKIEHLKREHAQEKLRLEQDRASAVHEKDIAKKEMDNINEQLKQKEIQLNTFGKTLQELESVTREKRQLESHVQKLESSTGDSKVLLDGQRKELMALNEALAKLQERNTRLEAENHTIQADFKAQKETGNREARELNIAINELKSQHENERHYLNDNISQTQTRLRSVEASLATAASDRDSAQAKCRLLENTVEELQSKLSDESTGRRLTEQSVGTLRLQLEDMKNDKNVTEARFVEMKNQVAQAEEKLKKEEEKYVATSAQLQELNAISHTNRSTVKAKSEQIEMLQKEISNLKQIVETQKQNLNGKMKKSALEFKQQIESVEEDRDKLQLLNQQLSTDLDSCREHIASKNKENLKLQEEILVLEDNVRECKVKQKHAEDTLRIEVDKQAELNARFEAQEEELKRLRNFLAKKVEQSGDSDKTMWQEMNRAIQDLSRQMTSHLDSSRGGDKDKSPESLVSRLRKQLAEVQGELNTEKSLHDITKTSVVALEEDCQRLRKQLHHYRRREPPSGEKKHKNRMEAINAIIAKSQSRAQALLSSGGYYDDSMVSPRVRTHQASPRVGFHSPHHAESPDNSYCEDLSVASLPPMHYGLPASKS